jgi:hypothetical protein
MQQAFSFLNRPRICELNTLIFNEISKTFQVYQIFEGFARFTGVFS